MLLRRYEEYRPGEDGCDLVTTIDASIQYYVEKHLRQAVLDYDALNGAGAIAMDVNTGAILAMASLGDYDPNDFLAVSPEAQAIIDSAATKEEAAALLRDAQARQWRNKALSDTYEPGSTFKIITLSMALEEGKVSPGDAFYCGGSTMVTGRGTPIRCWKSGGHGSQTLTQAVQHSCNVAFVNIGLRVGAERFYDYCEAFGFLKLSEDPDASLTARTGIDLAGESGSIWWSKNTFCSKKNLSQLAAASFGQTFTITPLQLITAVSACVNGGRLMEPYVVQRLLAPDGSVSFEHEPKLVRRVISESTSRKVREILEQVVGDPTDGTGRNAAVPGYRIGGKTGTSEKVSLEARTGQKEYIVSFIGFAPADDPKIAVLVFLDTPSDKSGIYISGGQMAAPVVGRMMADILPYLGVEPEREDSAMTEMPACVGLDLPEASEKLKDADLRFRAEARDTLSYYGLYLTTMSSVTDPERQTVSSQSLPAGTALRHGTVVEVTLIDSGRGAAGKILTISEEHTMKLAQLLEHIDVLESTADPELEISGISYDSSKTKPGDLFVAIKGFEADGHRFIPKAVANGAAAVLCEDAPTDGTPYVKVSDCRYALALASRDFYGNPAARMKVVGFTGTSGKTSSTYILKHVLEAELNAKVGLIGTNGNMIGERLLHTEHTTPESLELHQLFRQMADEGCTHVVMEVSSHSLELERVAGIDYDVAVFTNLSQDHLDLHGTMDAYAAAKKKLFSQCKTGWVNIDDERGAFMMEGAACPILRYSAKEQAAELKASDIRSQRGRRSASRRCTGRACP